MKKNIKIVLIIVSVLIFLFLTKYRILRGPSVNLVEKNIVSDVVEQYLTKRYGDNNFKVTYVDYEYDMETLFDHSKKEGYLVGYKCNGLKSAVSIKGIYPNIADISDWFLEEYYYEDKDKNSVETYEIFTQMHSRAPKEKIEIVIFNKIKSEFDDNIQKIDIDEDDIYLEIPDDFGRIPTIDEIENDINLYVISSVSYTTIIEDDKDEEYKTKLKEYLKNKFGMEGNISSYKKDDLNIILFSGNRINMGNVLNN